MEGVSRQESSDPLGVDGQNEAEASETTHLLQLAVFSKALLWRAVPIVPELALSPLPLEHFAQIRRPHLHCTQRGPEGTRGSNICEQSNPSRVDR